MKKVRDVRKIRVKGQEKNKKPKPMIRPKEQLKDNEPDIKFEEE